MKHVRNDPFSHGFGNNGAGNVFSAFVLCPQERVLAGLSGVLGDAQMKVTWLPAVPTSGCSGSFSRFSRSPRQP